MESEYIKFLMRYGVETTPEQDAACLFLESKGLRFCVEFGYENAEGIAQGYIDWARFGRVGRA